MSAAMNDEARASESRKLPNLRKIIYLALGALALIWVVPEIVAGLGSIDIQGVERPYLLTFLFVWWDAIVPVFPSESLLNTGATLIASGDLDLKLWLLILVGGLGAVIGDSTLYWLARTVGRKYLAEKVEKAKQEPKISTAFQVLGTNAPLVIVAGRFVPGMRFVIGVTMGLERYPYGRFLPFSLLGGFFWAAYNCGFSYLIGSTRLGEYSLLSLLTSAAVTGGILTILYKKLKRSYEEHQGQTASSQPEPVEVADSTA
jgi:membrane protein DedA with SNARE-associated domain